MKIYVYCFWFFVLILLWQLILILKSVNDLLLGIDLTSSYDIKENNTIPHIIHQIWKTENLLTYPINNSHSQWKKFYPDYEIKLWTDKQIENLILTDEYKYLYKIYKSYPYSIQRADLARLIVIHNEGGIYADLDVYPRKTLIEKLILKNASFITGRSSTDICLINHFLIGEKHSHIIDYILKNIRQKSFLQRIYILPYLEVFSTGSIFLTNIIRKRMRLRNPQEDKLIILSNEELSSYIFHGGGRSWHLFDGYLFNQIDDHPKRFFIFIFIFLFFCCIIKFRKKIRRSIKFR